VEDIYVYLAPIPIAFNIASGNDLPSRDLPSTLTSILSKPAEPVLLHSFTDPSDCPLPPPLSLSSPFFQVCNPTLVNPFSLYAGRAIIWFHQSAGHRLRAWAFLLDEMAYVHCVCLAAGADNVPTLVDWPQSKTHIYVRDVSMNLNRIYMGSVFWSGRVSKSVTSVSTLLTI